MREPRRRRWWFCSKMLGPSLSIVAPRLPSGGSSPPAYQAGAVSTDLGATWTYNQQPPAWVIAKSAPSGNLPIISANWSLGSFWVQSVTSGLDTDQLFVQDTSDWGHYDPTTDVVIGHGLGSPISGTPTDRGEPVMAATYAALFVNGFTLVRTTDNCPAAGPTDTFNLHFGSCEWADYPNYDTDIFSSTVINYGQLVDLQNTSISGDGGASHTSIPHITTSGVHKLATLFTTTVAGQSVDGAAIIYAPSVVYTPLTPPTTIALQAGNQQGGDGTPSTLRGFIASDDFYAPQPAGDIPTLSTS